jgi:photosystem II stability/assembly factor-like uncharacterized protein
VKIFTAFITCTILFVGLEATETKTSSTGFFTSSVLDKLHWRCVGPANPGGRIDDVAVVENNPRIIYVATASGGLWKTTNNGVTWVPVFDGQTTSSIGDVTVAPSNPDVVWVGTGEPNNRQSSSWGDGVFKSTDGGKTWKNMGLRDTHHIGRIAIHPADPDTVYVAALGHLWGPNKERGLFRTTDGGETWVNTKYIDENTGFVDVVMNPENPSVLYAAAYQRRRRGWGFNGGGPGSGLYKTSDGGESWVKLENGLPSGNVGRIGVFVYRRNPDIVYATVEHKEGGVFRSEDNGLSWKKMSSINPRPMYYSKIRIDPNNDQKIWVLGGAMFISEDGGKTFKAETYRPQHSLRRIHSDHHAMWINPADSNHMIVGSDGGIYFSYDGGQTWDFINTLPLGQVYEISHDMQNPYFVYGGLQDNDIWGGPSATRHSLGITNDDWFKITGGDGLNVQVDPTNHTTIYALFQQGNLFRFDLKTGESKPLRPEPEKEKETFRFNWNSPILISPHNPNTIYLGGNKLFTSHDRGETWESSIDLTKQIDPDKLPLMGTFSDENTLSLNDGIACYSDITTVAESPLKKGLLYVGTDDGNLQVSRNGGKTWKNVADKIPGVPKNTYVSRVIASSHAEGSAYAAFDGHRDDNFKAYVFLTTDCGESWKSISSNLPEGGTVNVIREHHRNPNLLFVGTERGAYVSMDRGKNWVKIKSNLPIVPVDDIAIHPQTNDLILGTHGRSIWILDDITPLEQLTESLLASPCHLFRIRETIRFIPFDNKGTIGHRFFVAPNPPEGAIISYYLRDNIQEGVKIVIENKEGKKIRELKGPGKRGISRINWDLRYSSPPQATQGEFGRYFSVQAPPVLPGEYKATLIALGKKMSETLEVAGDPRLDVSFEARKNQHEALYFLYSLYPLLHATCQTVVDISEQASAVKKALKELPQIPESLHKEAAETFNKIEDVRLELLGNPKLGWSGVSVSVRANLVLPGRTLEGYTGAPSYRLLQKIQKNAGKLQSLIKKMNEIIKEDIPRLNRLLKKNNISPQISAEKIKVTASG